MLLFSLLLATSTTTAIPTHTYTFDPLQRPPPGAFEVMEDITNVDQCFKSCDKFSSTKGLAPCSGFSLLNATGAYLCAYFHSAHGVITPNPPERDLVGFYRQGRKGPAPAPAPPLPPPEPVPPPTPPALPAPDHFTATLHTDVGPHANATIVLDVDRANAPHGVDQFYRLCGSIGFYNGAALIRVVPGVLVEWGVSANSTLNAEYGHTPIPDDPFTGTLSNVEGTLAFADGGMGRATVLFLNLADNSKVFDKQGLVPIATVADDSSSMNTARAIFDPTPNSTAGVPPQAYADNGNGWIRKTYPGINFITKCVTQVLV